MSRIARFSLCFALLLVAPAASGCELEPYCLTGCAEGPADAGDAGLVDLGESDAGPTDLGPPPCIPTGDELCNELDDDCDGMVDEGFDLLTSPRDCGRCGNTCRALNADVTCVSGACVVTACLDGFADLDPITEDCEYRCPVFPVAAESCNGLDDDCDGQTDESAELPPPPADLCRTTPGTPCASARPVCTTRGTVTAWFCDYATTVEFDPSVPNGLVLEESRCDGEDGDCDGVADDAFTTLGDACDDGGRGACRDEGVIRCDPADPSGTRCDLAALPDPAPGAPSAERCNAVDDDCDGIVDNADPTDPARVRDAMVHIVRGGADFWIDAYEASRPDATRDALGTSSGRACSNPDVRPWSRVSFADAEAACASAGKRLCTGAEWRAACEGAAARTYPYGNAYEGATCNGADRDAVPGGAIDNAESLTGALAMCVSEDGALDLSGNVKEWTNDARGTVGTQTIYVVRGGSYESPALGLGCATDLSRATGDTLLPTLGFRCCRDTEP
jgi:hypothetical protein